MALTLSLACGFVAVASPSASTAQGPPPTPVGADPIEVALDHLAATTLPPPASVDGSSKPTASTVREPDLRVTSTATSVGDTVTHVYVQQTLDGRDIVGAVANVAVADGRVVHAPGTLVAPDPEEDLDDEARIGPAAATVATLRALGLVPAEPIVVIAHGVEPGSTTTLTTGGVAASPITVRQVWAEVGKGLRLAWEVVIDVADSADWWEVLVDADTGSEIDRFNYNIAHSFHRHGGHVGHTHAARTASLPAASPFVGAAALVADGSSYRVFPTGAESPLNGPRVLLTEPADDLASPFGWHDLDGVLGAESTLTTGNNVDAFTDRDDDNVADAGSRPDGGVGLDFDFPLEFDADPTTQTEAAVTQLFVSSNFAHDFLYAYGFDEASGNFQTNNYGRGGIGGDPVLAEAQGAEFVGNANFATPPDGFAPRMQNYFWFGGAGNPALDGVFDQGVVLHEYGHGLSVRLTGGPANATCLGNLEQAGEGWSDYVALIATMQPDDQGTDRRGIGNYVTLQSIDGRGIRAFPYSTDPSIDPRTYADIATSSVPHGVGSIWTTLLWEMTWELIAEHGLDPDVVRGTGGNNIAMQLVVDGLKLQPCSPGFVEARDAILQADANRYDGENTCLIWEAFARRGLGAGASQGSADDHTDGVESYVVPPECSLEVSLSSSGDTTNQGGEVTFRVRVDNNTERVQTDVAIAIPLPDEFDYVDGSASCAGSESAGTVRMTVLRLDPDASATCTLRATAGTSPAITAISEDFTDGAGDWTFGNGPDTFDIGHVDTTWRVESNPARGGSNTAHAPGAHDAPANAQAGDLLLTLSDPIDVPDGATLSFWHDVEYEPFYDGGVVEISTDGGSTWVDLGSDIVSNGYTARISGGDLSPIAGRPAFTGNSDGFVETVIDLCRFSGETALLRFRAATDPSVTSGGWWIDDVEVSAGPSASITATATSSSDAGATNRCVDVALGAATVPDEPPVGPTALATTARAEEPAKRIRSGG